MTRCWPAEKRLADAEKLELMALVADAWEAASEDRVGAAERLVDWWDAVPFDRARKAVWARQARRDRLVALLRETCPQPFLRRWRNGRSRPRERQAEAPVPVQRPVE